MVSRIILLVVVVSAATAAPQLAPRDTSRHVHRHAPELPRATIEDVRFLLWTRNNSGDGAYQELVEGDATTLGPYNAEDPTVVLIHGFSSKGYEGWPVDAKTELLKAGSYNVLSVDWSKLAVAPWYPAAVRSVPQVGAHTARLLEWLQAAAGLDVARLQVTGHSLGAHVSGAVGQHLKQFRLPFITGMDPAGPWFYDKPDSERLDKTDADFVQVIHTNGGDLLEMCVGLKEELGHVDVYPSGGEHQPGCTVLGDWMDLLVGGCSHARSTRYFIESINGWPSFVARPCPDWPSFLAGGCDSCGAGCLLMGLHADPSMRGVYYLSTNRRSPFAQGTAYPPSRVPSEWPRLPHTAHTNS